MKIQINNNGIVSKTDIILAEKD